MSKHIVNDERQQHLIMYQIGPNCHKTFLHKDIDWFIQAVITKIILILNIVSFFMLSLLLDINFLANAGLLFIEPLGTILGQVIAGRRTGDKP